MRRKQRGEKAKSDCLRKQTPLLTGPTLSATITYFCIYVLYGIWNISFLIKIIFLLLSEIVLRRFCYSSEDD